MIKRIRLALMVITVVTLSPHKVKAWGYEGHAIIAKLAMHFLQPDVRQNVLGVLGTISIDTAANWMDIVRANSDYDFMKPWHYIDFDKEKQYTPSTDENIVNRIIITFNELRHKKVLCSDQIKTDLLILLHLMGDLSQPLHAGYEYDLGGNRAAIQYDTLKTNLHKFWDEDMIRLGNITLEECLRIYQSNNGIDTIDGIHPVLWMKETRSLLPAVYNYEGFTIGSDYVKRNREIVIRQLLLAGIRLAKMLDKLFPSEAAELNMQDVATKYKNGIDARDTPNYIGKKVTACGKVFGIRSTDKVTFINVGNSYPNSPLTVVIFAKDRKSFPLPIEDLFSNKNICIKGEVVEYKGKAEIIVTSPSDLFTIE